MYAMSNKKQDYGNKAVIYARVSSNKQEREGYSIPAQIELLKEYAIKNDFEVIKIFQEAETAKKAGRTQFNEMLKFLNKNLDIRNILVEKTDRLQRNIKDYATLGEYKHIAIHLVKEGQVISKNATSHQKFMHGMKVLMAKQYIDNLSEEVIKGQTEKAKEGIYPSTAPLGYLNADNGHGKRIIVVDEERAPYIKRAFELYATDTYSSLEICNLMYKEGLRSKKGCKVSKSTFERMFKNNFYIGKFQYSGYICDKAQHEALIDEHTFNVIQERLNGISKAKTHNVEFSYQGLIRCSICGGMLSPELKKKKYIYYRCNDYYKKGCKKKSYINQDVVDKSISDILKSFKITQVVLDDVLTCIKELHKAKNEYQEHTNSQITKQITTLQNRIEQLYADKCDGKVNDDFWVKMNKKWHAEKTELINQLQRINRADEEFYNMCEMLLKFCKNAHNMYLNGTAEEKRFITSTVISNITYYDKKLDIELFPVFYILSDLIKEEDKKFSTLEPTESIDFTNKKDPKKGQFVNGGNYVVNLELYLDKLKAELSEKTSQKVIFMLKFLQERKIA